MKSHLANRPARIRGKLLVRIIKILDQDFDEIALNIGIPTKDFMKYCELELYDKLGDATQIELFGKLYDYVTKRIGELSAVRAELDNKIAQDRAAIIARRAAIRNR